MRNKLIEVLLGVRGLDGKPVINWPVEAAIFADALLEAGVIAPEWVSVEDALPENGKRVLVVHSASVWNGGKKLDVDCVDEYKGDRYWRRHDYDVTHWLPLPAPPKEE